jgi:hypothetical protein
MALVAATGGLEWAARPPVAVEGVFAALSGRLAVLVPAARPRPGGSAAAGVARRTELSWALLAGHAHFGGAARLRRDEGEDGQGLLCARVRQRVLDTGRNERRIHRLELFGLDAGAQTGVAFDDDIHRVGGVLRRTRLRLLCFEADQLADHARAVENVDPHRAVAQEPSCFQKLDYFHKDSILNRGPVSR